MFNTFWPGNVTFSRETTLIWKNPSDKTWRNFSVSMRWIVDSVLIGLEIVLHSDRDKL
jgi:hypothetical protein